MKKLLARITRRGGRTPHGVSTLWNDGGRAQAPARAAPVLHAVPPGRRRSRAPGRSEARRLRGDGPGDRRAEAGGLRRGAQRPSTSRRSCSSGSTRPAWNACETTFGGRSRTTSPRRRKRPPSPSRDCSPSLRPATGILDRRFYAVCEFGRIDELPGPRQQAAQLVDALRGRQLRMFLVSAALGGIANRVRRGGPRRGGDRPAAICA